jgi:iron(III) transport system substrate-binding protein
MKMSALNWSTVGIFVLCALQAPILYASSDPQIIEAAKKEGAVTYYTTMTVSQSQILVDKFQDKYPPIKVELFRTGGDPLLNKIQTEARGGLHAWDVVSGRGDMVLPLLKDKLIASYRSPEAKHIDRDLVDDDGFWTAFYVNPYVLGFNTKRVSKDELPKTYEDLLNPRWKDGKISIDDEAYGLLSGLIKAWGKEKAVTYFKKLAAQNPVVMRGNTNRVQLAVAGEYDLIIAYAPTIQRETSRGAPIDWVPLEPVPVQVNPAMLAADAPHTNAGKLFIDYLLSDEGQRMLIKFNRIPVREDIEPNPPRLFRGYKRIVEHPEEYKNFPQTVKLYQDIFGSRQVSGR